MKKPLIILALAVTCFSLPAADNLRPPRFGAGLRLSAYGIPDALLDPFLAEYPGISGGGLAFEIRTYGKRGPRSSFSWIFALEYSRMRGKGEWREDAQDPLKSGEGEATQLSATATILWHIFPRWAVHPYIGAGIGLGRMQVWAEGVYEDNFGNMQTENQRETLVVPTVHLPVGILIRVSPGVELRLEGGFKNGFYLGGGMIYAFR